MPHATPPLTLHALDADALDAVLAIERRVTPHPWTRGHFQDSLNAGHYAVALRRGPELLGYCIAMPGYQEAHLLNIAIAPEHQRQGLALRLMAALTDWARHTARAEALWLEVRTGNLPAQQLYLRQGFRRTGVRKGYYPCPGGVREDALVMRLPLEESPPCP